MAETIPFNEDTQARIFKDNIELSKEEIAKGYSDEWLVELSKISASNPEFLDKITYLFSDNKCDKLIITTVVQRADRL